MTLYLFILAAASFGQPGLPNPASFIGTYSARLPAASSPGREITLTLADRGVATLRSDYLNDTPAIVETGTWRVSGAQEITVTLTGRADQKYDTPKVMKFRLESALALAAPDSKEWGSEGLRLTRSVPTAIAGRWELEAILYGDDSKAIPEVPANYTLDFQPDGRVAVRADCNRGSGTYSVSGSQISFGPIALTRMACPPGSIDAKFVRGLTAAVSYMRDGDALVLAMKIDTGTMRFRPAK
ncbi:MAG TPA: META domain-containing protein [Vicinamibacterales bacterium]|nr:META domain-containing protein [Vicinamibacterales bacterium]